MKNLFSILISLILSCGLAGQSLSDIITNHPSNLKKGFYKNFHEFKFNNPSIPFDHKLIPIIKSHSKDKNNQHISWHVDITKEEAKEIGEIYGFCDGKKVYVLEEIYITDYINKFKPNTNFEEVLYLGRYAFFETINKVNSWATSPWGGYYPLEPISIILAIPNIPGGIIIQVINMKSGEVFTLNKKRLEAAIIDDNDLVNDFNSMSNKEKKMLQNQVAILMKYSEKHQLETIITE